MNNSITDELHTTADRMRERATELGNRANTAVDDASTAAGERMESVGGSLRHSGDAAAERLETAGAYLKEHTPGDIVEDLGDVMRRHPKVTLAAGLALGFMLARLITK